MKRYKIHLKIIEEERFYGILGFLITNEYRTNQASHEHRTEAIMYGVHHITIEKAVKKCNNVDEVVNQQIHQFREYQKGTVDRLKIRFNKKKVDDIMLEMEAYIKNAILKRYS